MGKRVPPGASGLSVSPTLGCAVRETCLIGKARILRSSGAAVTRRGTSPFTHSDRDEALHPGGTDTRCAGSRRGLLVTKLARNRNPRPRRNFLAGNQIEMGPRVTIAGHA